MKSNIDNFNCVVFELKILHSNFNQYSSSISSAFAKIPNDGYENIRNTMGGDRVKKENNCPLIWYVYVHKFYTYFVMKVYAIGTFILN